MFTIRTNNEYKDVFLEYNHTHIDMGLLNKQERRALAEELLSAVSDLVLNDFDCSLEYEKFLKEST